MNICDRRQAKPRFKLFGDRQVRICLDCKCELTNAWLRCSDCTGEKARERNRIYAKKWPLKVKAHQAVASAVKKGDIKPVTTLHCVDCGKQATCYDHRDYSKPLEVEPVCHSCNKLRGEGINYREDAA